MAVLSWPEPFLVLWSKEASALRECSRALYVVNVCGEILLGEPKVIEAYQARVTGLQRADGLVLGMGWVLPSLLVFGERQWR